MNSFSMARLPDTTITDDLPTIDHHSHAAYIRPGEKSGGMVDAEREAAAATVESSIPHDDYIAYVGARSTGDRAMLDSLEARYGIELIYKNAIANQENTVYMRSLHEAARVMHGEADAERLREVSRARTQSDPVGLYDEALSVSNTELVLTDVPFIDHNLWSADRYKQIVRIDPYLYPFGHPEFLRRGSDSPRFRRVFEWILDSLLEGSAFDVQSMSFGEYLEFVRASITQRQNRGAVGLKIASAYVRTLHFVEPTFADAKDAYRRLQGRGNSELDLGDYLTLGNFLVYHIAELAVSRELPVQIHVGRGHSEPGLLVSEAHPVLLEPLLCTPRLNQLRIILIHGGFPYTSFVTVLAQTYGNVYADFSWMPIMHHRVLERTLEEWLEHLPANKVIFGTDTGSAEFHLAATQRARGALGRVLERGVAERQWSAPQAEKLARRALRDNVAELYQLQVSS